jgi:hypothetical protein
MATTTHETVQMLWPEHQAAEPEQPQRLLLEAIADGSLDHHLIAIGDAIHARRELLHTVRAANAISRLCVGDAVQFNHHIRPRYLEHERGVITEIEDRWVAVRLEHSIGRFRRDGKLRCPPLTLDRL